MSGILKILCPTVLNKFLNAQIIKKDSFLCVLKTAMRFPHYIQAHVFEFVPLAWPCYSLHS